MRGGLICEFCRTYHLQIIYIRQTLKNEPELNNEPKKRKQAFVRIGVRCQVCGSVFLDSEIFKQWRDKQKEQRKFHRKIPRGTPKIKEFVEYEEDWNSGKLKRVRS